MALGKPIVTPNGTANFWIIGTLWRDVFNKTAYAQLCGYESREASDNRSSTCIERYNYNIPSTIYDTYLGLTTLKSDGVCDLGEIYTFIKTYDTRFSDAVDLIYEEG